MQVAHVTDSVEGVRSGEVTGFEGRRLGRERSMGSRYFHGWQNRQLLALGVDFFQDNRRDISFSRFILAARGTGSVYNTCLALCSFAAD